MPSKEARPFPIQMEVEFFDRLSEPVREGRAKSISAIVRKALEEYDFANVVVMRPAQLMISVRLPVDIRRNLKQMARTKNASIGQLVRAAIEAYLPQIETGEGDQLVMPITPLPVRAESLLAPGRKTLRKKTLRKAPRIPRKRK